MHQILWKQPVTRQTQRVFIMDENNYTAVTDALTSSADINHDKIDISPAFSPINELKFLSKNTIYIAAQVLLEFLPFVYVTIIVGHYYDGSSTDDENISATGLATTYSGVTGEGFTWGMTTALYTLVPQAVGYGDPNIPINKQSIVKNALAINLHRSFAITCIIAIPCILFQFLSGTIMTSLGEPTKIESRITNYSLSLMPWIIGSALFSAMQRIIQAIDLNSVATLGTLLNAVISLPIMYVFIYYCNMGYLAGGAALSLSFWCMMIFTVIMLHIKGYGFLFEFGTFGIKTIFDRKDFIGFIKLSLPGLLQTVLEWGVIEIAVLLSGHVGDNNQKTISISSAVIMYDFYLITYALANGIASAVNISIAKHIGANNIEDAKQASKWSVIFTLTICIIMTIIFISVRNSITVIFTHNPDTDELVSVLILSFALYAFFYVFAQMFSGLYRGLGAQDKTAVIELICYYTISIPLIFITLFGMS